MSFESFKPRLFGGVFVFLISTFAHGDDVLVECKGRSYLHRIAVISSAPLSIQYERRWFFQERLEEAIPVHFDSGDFLRNRFQFSSQDAGLGMTVSGGDTKNERKGRIGLKGTGSVFKRGGPMDLIRSCWIDVALIDELFFTN